MPLNGIQSPQNGEKLSPDFGPHLYGAKLFINEEIEIEAETVVAVDCETNERDGFVGLALCADSPYVFYFTDLELVRELLPRLNLVGHNIKGDLKWLKSWGVNVSEKNLFFDTMIASYVINPVRDSHGLKPLSKDVLLMSWPSYAEVVGKGRKKKTLDKQPVELVARYCGMDVLGTFKLYNHFNRVMTPNQRRLFSNVEMPLNRILFQMEDRGVKVNLTLLGQLDKEFAEKIEGILATVKALTDKEIEKLLLNYKLKQLKEKWEQSAFKAFDKNRGFNPGSWQQKRLLLKFLGLDLGTTDKKTLIRYRGNKLIDLLLEHSEFAKLYNAFITAFKELPTLPIIHTTYSQVSEDKKNEDVMHGIRTGRLSSKNPNLQQIPARTENGKLLRKLFVPRDGHTFIVADYSQIELRLAAHFSHDPTLLKSFKEGKDVHDETAKALGVERFWGKTANFLLAFGGSHYRLMDSLNIDEEKAEEFYAKYWNQFRVLDLWKRRAVDMARMQGGVRTLIGRWIPVEGLDSYDWRVRGMAERFAISGIIQGSAADVMKLAILETKNKGYPALLTVHDELVFEVSGAHAYDEYVWGVQDDIKAIMETVVKLDVPLEATIGHGPSWGEAKN